jgi:histidinol-phosphatase (PHP family)
MYDYHTHTSFSTDSNTSMADMIDAACAVGLKEMAITDHYDPEYPDPSFPFEIKFEDYHNALDKAKEENKNRIKILKGLEVGIQYGYINEKCRNQVNSFDYDFILGSFHCAEGYELDTNRFYQNKTTEESYLAFYNYMYNNLKEYKDYDVLGHFNIIDRYAPARAENSVYMDIVEEIVKLIIADGKGIEINTSSFRYGMGDRTTPAREILQLYADLGGEIITIGSDSHRTKDLGYKFDTAVEMIKSAGLKYLATYDQRKVNFVKL